MLDYQKTKKILDKYKIPLVQSKLIENREEGFLFAKNNGYPVVLKSAGGEIIHRTEKKAVITDIRGKAGLEKAYNQLLEIEKIKEGEVLIQKQIKGRELMIGAKIDPTFGPVVLFGIGGIYVEVYEDIAYRLAPVEKKETENMIKEIRGAEILGNFRGQKPIDFATLKDLLVKTSHLISQEKDIKELDFNPAIANPKGVWVVDAKVVPQGRGTDKN